MKNTKSFSWWTAHAESGSSEVGHGEEGDCEHGKKSKRNRVEES